MDRRRAFGGLFILAVCVSVGLHLYGIMYMFDEKIGIALMVFEFGGSMGFSSPIMPLVAALPYATSFVADYSSGFCPPVTVRSGKCRYIASKAMYTAVSGGAAVAVGMIIYIIILNIKFPGATGGVEIAGASDLLGIAANPGIFSLSCYYAARVLLQFMSGAFWALTALTFSAFYPNLPLTLCVPLVSYRLASAVGSLWFMPPFMNLTWLDDGQIGYSAAFTVTAGVLVFGGLAVVLALVFAWRARRRLSYA